MALCFLSPLCNLGVALFAARSSQHVLLVLVAAPLLAMGLPARGGAARVLASSAAFAGIVWLWHSPRLYDLTLQNNVAYWGMHVTMVASAVWFWRCAFSTGGLGALVGVSFVGLEMSLLGALIVFAHAPFYVVHATTTQVWGLSQMGDQRLGGLIMWVPAGVLGLGYSVVAIWLWLARLDHRNPRHGLAVVVPSAQS
jgi:putative membrane protein